MIQKHSESRSLPAVYRAVTCLGGDRTCLEERPLIRPDTGEILLRLRVAGLCGTDLFKLDSGHAQRATVLGHEVVGEVIATGEGVTKFNHGDRVVVPHHVSCGECYLCHHDSETLCETFRENLLEPGGFADYILVRPRATALAAFRLPESLTDRSAVFMEPAACVLRGVRRSGVNGESVVAVLGAGTMGLLYLLVLRSVMPGISVVVIDPEPERLRMAEVLGATMPAFPGSAASQAVGSLSSGRGADAVFDTVGGADILNVALSLTREGGSVVLFAHSSEGESASFEINGLFKFEKRILGTYSGALREQREIFDLLSSAALNPSPLVTHEIPLGNFQDAVDIVRRRQALKVLLTPTEVC